MQIPGVPQMVITVAAIVGAVIVWPSDLAWALFALAAVIACSLVFDFEFEAGERDDDA